MVASGTFTCRSPLKIFQDSLACACCLLVVVRPAATRKYSTPTTVKKKQEATTQLRGLLLRDDDAVILREHFKLFSNISKTPEMLGKKKQIPWAI